MGKENIISLDEEAQKTAIAYARETEFTELSTITVIGDAVPFPYTLDEQEEILRQASERGIFPSSDAIDFDLDCTYDSGEETHEIAVREVVSEVVRQKVPPLKWVEHKRDSFFNSYMGEKLKEDGIDIE